MAVTESFPSYFNLVFLYRYNKNDKISILQYDSVLQVRFLFRLFRCSFYPSRFPMRISYSCRCLLSHCGALSSVENNQWNN